MTLVEAVKSGKPFRRPSYARGSWVVELGKGPAPGVYVWRDEVQNTKAFSAEDILATDWETEEKTREITLSEFVEAFKRAASTEECMRNYPCGPTVGELAKELGLL